MSIKIDIIQSENLMGEASRLWEDRKEEGFWNRFVRPGVVLDIGYKGAFNSSPIFRDAEGLDIDTPGYDGMNIPYAYSSIGTIHASHLLEHISDYAYFLRECFRVLANEGTLILFVPLMQAYERKLTPPSLWNPDHKRFYTASRLLSEIETTLARNSYRVIHLRECFNPNDLTLPVDIHASGPYEIECVIEKIQ